MKKILTTIVSLLVASVVFFGCSNGSSDSGSGEVQLPVGTADIADGYFRVNLKKSGECNLWIWKDFDKTETDKCVSWPNGIQFTNKNPKNDQFIYVDIKLAENPTILGLICVDSKGQKYSGQEDVFFYFPHRYNQIYFDGTTGTTWIDAACTKKPFGLSSANLTGVSVITANQSNLTFTTTNVTVTDKNGNKLTVASVDNSKITLADSIKDDYSTLAPLTLNYKEGEIDDTVTVGIDISLVESWFGSPAAKDSVIPGLTLTGSTAKFVSWAPLAQKVSVLLFTDASKLKDSSYLPTEIPMTAGKNGMWIAEDVDVSGFKYYKYRISIGTVDYDVCDIWHTVASADSVASQIVDINDSSAIPASWETSYVNPFGNSGAVQKNYSDAVIYEMHIRDWSRAFVPASTGKFQDITDNLGDSGEFTKHLKDLCVTHVQILPMFDYSQTNRDDSYNWGYNPYHYNVPEGRYVNYGTNKDGTDAVIQMREMIKAFHDAGIAVIMDVVYNHTSGTGANSLYDSTVPEYYYWQDANGNYINYSGCGNGLNLDRKMVRKYVIDSLKHWMNDYHVNGFRFDLMGIHSNSAMKEIYDELYKVDKNVMVYGEPWTGNGNYPENGCKETVDSTPIGVGAFDDDFRDAVKGAEFGGFYRGQVQNANSDDGIIKGLMGQSGKNKRNSVTSKPELALHYAECHDNYTLADKLCYSTVGSSILQKDNIVDKFVGYDSLSSANKELVRAEDKLCAAYIFLAQGTPFINGGQEFMRTKKGNPDSYSSDTKGGKFWSKTEIDECNTIDLSYKTKFADVYNTYKGLIALRKENSAAFGANTSAKAETVKTGVTKYTTRDFLVYFNASDSAEAITTTGYSKVVDVTSGAPTESSTLPSSVAAKSFVILKK